MVEVVLGIWNIINGDFASKKKTLVFAFCIGSIVIFGKHWVLMV